MIRIRRDIIVSMAGLFAATAALWGATTARASETAFIISGSDTQVHASATQLRVTPEPGFVHIGYPQRNHVGLIDRPVRVPAAAVGRAVGETPALPYLAKVKIGATYILVDPEVDYLASRPGHLDEGHTIIKAQRTYRALHAHGGAYVVRKPGVRARREKKNAGDIKPEAIFLRPDVLEHPGPDDNPDHMPTLPTPPGNDHQPKMARAR